ncbi:MAG: TetR family transcriptional regulator [Deltaproteobacteria bacterium]|jgi:AcrR family transcriptional regulator|nr:TetR family transcriptional regulator [Deltaproteobacteria bacterium]
MPRPSLTPDEIQVFRGRMCELATRRFAERGLAGVSLRGLAQEMGCSPNTPYRYFDNKDEIFASVRARAFERLAQACDEVRERETDPERRLTEMGRAYLRFAREEPSAYRVAFELDQPDSVAYPELVAERRRAWGAIRGAVEHAIRCGVLEGDPETVSHLYWAGLHGLAALQLAGQLHARDLDDLEAPMIEALLRGTRRPDSSPLPERMEKPR